MREAGATAAQELAFTLADAIAYVEAAVARGLDVDDFAGRLSFFFAAWSELFEEVAKFRVGPPDVGDDHARAVRGDQPAVVGLPLPRPDRRLEPDRPVGRQQRGPDDHPGPRRGPRRRPEPPHELARRGAGAADRGGGPPRAPDPADPRLRGRRDRDARPAGRLLLRREPDQRARGGRLGATSTRSRRWAGPSPPSRAASSSARSRRPPTGSSGRSSRATRSSSGSTASATTRSTTPPLHRIDPDGERRQIERVRRVRAERSAEAWTTAMDRLEATARGDGNLMPRDPRRGPRLRHGRRDQRPPAGRLGRAPRAHHGLKAWHLAARLRPVARRSPPAGARRRQPVRMWMRIRLLRSTGSVPTRGRRMAAGASDDDGVGAAWLGPAASVQGADVPAPGHCRARHGRTPTAATSSDLEVVG